MRRLGLVIFVLAILVSLAVFAPASLLDDLVRHYSQDRLVMANARGTIWSGSATPGLRVPDGHVVAIQPLRWEIDFLPMLKGQLNARMHWENQEQAPVTGVRAAAGHIVLSNVFIPLPASLLNEASPILKPAEFRGQMDISSGQLVFSRRGMEGVALVDWRHAGSALSSIDPLGNYRFSITGSGNVVKVDLATTSGVLVLSGQGEWSASGGLEFDGQAHASEGNQERLGELLHHLGPEVSPGVASFRLTSRN